MFWIENALYPLICDVFIQTCKFIHFLENSGIGLAFSSIFNVFWFLRVGATLSFWVQFGCKSPKKRIHCNNAQQTLLFYTSHCLQVWRIAAQKARMVGGMTMTHGQPLQHLHLPQPCVP
jgi:hypothetical protein